MKMAEQEMGIEQETRPVDNRHDEEETGEGNGETNTTLLAGLNLVLIVSFLSLSDEDRSNLDEIQETETEGSNHKNNGASRSSFQTRRKLNESPAVERQTSTVHTKIRDSR